MSYVEMVVSQNSLCDVYRIVAENLLKIPSGFHLSVAKHSVQVIPLFPGK